MNELKSAQEVIEDNNSLTQLGKILARAALQEGVIYHPTRCSHDLVTSLLEGTAGPLDKRVLDSITSYDETDLEIPKHPEIEVVAHIACIEDCKGLLVGEDRIGYSFCPKRQSK